MLILSLIALVGAASAAFVSSNSVLNIPAARKALALEMERIDAELAELPAFGESRQIEAYGFHGDYLPVLDELPDEPRWSISLEWGALANLEQVLLVPAIDPRLGALKGYGFPRRFRVLHVQQNGQTQVLAEWMDQDCPDPAHVPLRISVPKGRCSKIRIDVYRGAQEGQREFFALAEVFGVVLKELWLPRKISAKPEFESRPYWSRKYLSDQKMGLGMPLGKVSKDTNSAGGEFSVSFEESAPDSCLVELDLGQCQKMGWLTLYPVVSPSESIVPGYGFPGEIVLIGVKEDESGQKIQTTIKSSWSGDNPGDNAIRLPLFGYKGRWLQIRMSDLAEHNGHKILALGETKITMREKVVPVQRIRLGDFPEKANALVGALMDGRVDGRAELQMMDWFALIEHQHDSVLAREALVEKAAELERRWLQMRGRVVVGLGAAFLLLFSVWIIRRRISMKRLQLRIIEERHHTEIEQMKLRFFTHISHELRTPLTVIPAPIERAMKEVGEGRLRNYLGVALRNVHELQHLVEQILDLRQIQDGKMKISLVEAEPIFHVCTIVDSIRPLAENKGIHLVFDSNEEAGVICRFDPRACKRILVNLIANAIKFTPSGGSVSVNFSVNDQGMELSVSDTGPGINEADIANIFEQHYRGKTPTAQNTAGSGVGLALVHEVVGLLGGTVTVESPIADGHGSRFLVTLPRQLGIEKEG